MNSRDYWAKREEEALKNRIKDEKEYSKEIHQIYDNMLNSIQDQIDAFYTRYATAEGISLAEAKKRVSQADIKAYERKAKQYVKNKDFSDKANQEMRLYNATMKINRLELLKANIGLEMVKGHDDMDNFMREILEERTVDELRRQAGILGGTVQDNAKRVDAIVNGSFKVDKVGSKTTFSDRIWQYQDVMKQDLSKLLQTGLIQGKNSRALAGDLRKYWYGKDPKTGGGAVFCMERLMRTELARVQTEAQKQSYADNDIEEYEYIANSRCCDACQALDGKIFKVKDMMPGENAAPLHPNCRCSCGAYEDEEEYEAWLSFIESGGTTKEWNKLKTSAGNKSSVNISKTNKKSLENSTKSSKIELENIKIIKGVGASGKNYPVKLPSGNHVKFVEGTEITNVTVFAGKGTSEKIKDTKRLENVYDIPASEWMKVSGNGYIMENGKKRLVEVHWYEAEDDRFEMKVKRYLDES